MVNGTAYFNARDGSPIRYATALPDSENPAGTVVLLGGRTEFIEKHAETIAELNRRNLMVNTMDWRGQGLSSRLLKDRQKGHILSFSQYINDLSCFMETVVSPNAVSPIIFLAHSMGGHITLRYMSEQDSGIAAAVLVAPMIEIRLFPMPQSLVRRLVWLAVRAGWAERYVVGASGYDPKKAPFKNNPLTSDWERFIDENIKIAENPDLAIGGVTYGWLCAALQSIEILKASKSLQEKKVPVLMVGGSDDRVVSIPAMKQICRRLANCRSFVIDRARHDILREADPMRQAFWQEFDNFVQSPV